MGGLFQSFREPGNSMSEKIKLEFDGVVPNWLKGKFIRTGPGIYEFGNRTYDHLFDPLSVLQQFQFNNGKVHYSASIVNSTHYRANKRADDIVRAELGTYGEEAWVTRHEDGSKIENEDVIKQNRIDFLLENGYVTDNTNIQTYAINGIIVSFSDTIVMNVHDTKTLETIGQLDMTKAPNFPHGYFCTMQSSHGQFDDEKNFFNIMVCQTEPSMTAPVPTVAYIPYMIKHVGKLENHLDVLDHVTYGAPFYNKNRRELKYHYFHSIGLTENYIVIPLNSLVFNCMEIPVNTLAARPITDSMHWDPETDGEFILIDKKTFQIKKRYTTHGPLMIMHLVNTYEDLEHGKKIIIDGAQLPNGHIYENYKFDVLNTTGADLIDTYEKLAPMGTVLRWTLHMSNGDHDTFIGPEIKPEVQEQIESKDEKGENIFEKAKDNSEWENFMNGGVEFPVMNPAFSGKKYDHYWAAGFGGIFQDRLYHVKISTLERWTWRQEGYHPSEPIFIPHPRAIESGLEDTGVLLSLCSPFKTDKPALDADNKSNKVSLKNDDTLEMDFQVDDRPMMPTLDFHFRNFYFIIIIL